MNTTRQYILELFKKRKQKKEKQAKIILNQKKELEKQFKENLIKNLSGLNNECTMIAKKYLEDKKEQERDDKSGKYEPIPHYNAEYARSQNIENDIGHWMVKRVNKAAKPLRSKVTKETSVFFRYNLDDIVQALPDYIGNSIEIIINKGKYKCSNIEREIIDEIKEFDFNYEY